MFFLLDTFTDVDGTNLTAHHPEKGLDWTVSGAGTLGIASDRLKVSSAPGADVFCDNASVTSPDFFGTINLTLPAFVGTYVGIIFFRMIDANNLWKVVLIWTETTTALQADVIKIVGGVPTTKWSATLPVPPGNLRVRIVCQGPNFSVSVADFEQDFSDGDVNSGTNFKISFVNSGGLLPFEIDSVFFSQIQGANSMINLRSGRWSLHREGVAEILASVGKCLCEGTCLAITGEVRLWTSANAPACSDTVTDYTEALFSGYAPVVIDSGNGGCIDILEIGLDSEGIGQLVVDMQTWIEANPATITETINGAYLVLIVGGDEFLLGTFLFPVPAAMGDIGDVLKVGGFALLDCQMAP